MVEIDQSGKVERWGKDTILAFSNLDQYAIRIPASIKRTLLDRLQVNGKSRKNACIWIFSAGIYLLLKSHLPHIIKHNEMIVIDTEYTGHEANIKSMILRHSKNAGFKLPANRIRFEQIGKLSGAHKTAYAVHKGKIKENNCLKLKDFLGLM